MTITLCKFILDSEFHIWVWAGFYCLFPVITNWYSAKWNHEICYFSYLIVRTRPTIVIPHRGNNFNRPICRNIDLNWTAELRDLSQINISCFTGSVSSCYVLQIISAAVLNLQWFEVEVTGISTVSVILICQELDFTNPTGVQLLLILNNLKYI